MNKNRVYGVMRKLYVYYGNKRELVELRDWEVRRVHTTMEAATKSLAELRNTDCKYDEGVKVLEDGSRIQGGIYLSRYKIKVYEEI